MKNRKIAKTLIYERLGFPIKLNGIPMKKVFGEWCMDVNLEDLQRNVIHCLVYKKHSLTGAEIRFIRKYFEMTTTDFGKAFGVTHAAVSKWESNQNSVPLATDVYKKEKKILPLERLSHMLASLATIRRVTLRDSKTCCRCTALHRGGPLK